VKRLALGVLAIVLFAVIATANSGGYRYGVSDQAFYIPALALEAHPELFPRDRGLLEPQMHLWAAGRSLANLTRTAGSQPAVFLALYGVTLAVLAASASALARGIGANGWTTGAFLLLLTLRHRIAKTGANSLEGYMHPRMLAFAVGLGALAALVRQRWGGALALACVALWMHPTTGAWFLGLLALAAVWHHRRHRIVLVGAAGLAAAIAVAAIVAAPDRFARMDPAWLGVLAEKDYLFPGEWPLYAWVANLAYPAVLMLLFFSRRRRGATSPGEEALVAGAVGLAALFLISVPLADARIALVVQLQVNRVFWLLDALVALYIAWWLTEMLARRRTAVILVVLAAAAVGRGMYVLAVEARRPLVQMGLPRTAWNDAMAWVGTQQESWHVLADPGHAWKFGTSVRVAALRDTLLESGKDSAMAMYDRTVALRVADRTRALADFDTMTLPDLQRLDAAYGLDVFVDRVDRSWPLPVLYRNDEFVVYDLR
jgi:MYXO-CTERM domain-containing protein